MRDRRDGNITESNRERKAEIGEEQRERARVFKAGTFDGLKGKVLEEETLSKEVVEILANVLVHVFSV